VLFALAGIAAIIGGLILAIVLSVLQPLWIAAAAATLLRTGRPTALSARRPEEARR
jgi:hypothetical protein